MDAEAYLLGCQRYIELNPVRAQMVAHPADYPWSSYRVYAQGDGSALLTTHPCYLALGRDDSERQAQYRALFRDHLAPGVLDAIRHATHGGYCLGHERFTQDVAAMLGRRVDRGTPGRPKKRDAEDPEALQQVPLL